MKNILIGTIIILLSFSSLPVQAARLYFETAFQNPVGVGQKIIANVFLDSDQADVNAIETEVRYPKDLLKLVGFSDGNSLVSIWLERPLISDGTALIKGIIPNGFNWQHGLLIRLEFETLKEGKGAITFISGSHIFLNDGEGTEVTAKNETLNIVIARDGSLMAPEEKDGYPPEPFQPVVGQDASVFDGAYFVAFQTQDKHSGIDHYEIQETNADKVIVDKWEQATSPHQLKDQTWESYIFIKAIDRKGNERIEKIYPASYKPIQNRPSTYIIGIILILIAVLVTRRKKRKNI